MGQKFETVNTARVDLRGALLANEQVKGSGASVFFVGSKVERKLPYLIMTVEGCDPTIVKEGLPSQTGFIEVEIHAATQAEASMLMDATCEALHCYRSTKVRQCHVTDYGEVKYPPYDDYESWVMLRVKTN